MSDAGERNTYREKAIEMRCQAARAETPTLRTLYGDIAVSWDLQADAIEPAKPSPNVEASDSV
jgi:hypothetical protein